MGIIHSQILHMYGQATKWNSSNLETEMVMFDLEICYYFIIWSWIILYNNVHHRHHYYYYYCHERLDSIWRQRQDGRQRCWFCFLSSIFGKIIITVIVFVQEILVNFVKLTLYSQTNRQWQRDITIFLHWDNCNTNNDNILDLPWQHHRYEKCFELVDSHWSLLDHL